MPMGGCTIGRGFKFHAYRFNNCKEKQKQKIKIKNNKRCIYTTSLLHCTLEGVQQHRPPPPSKPRANPADSETKHVTTLRGRRAPATSASQQLPRCQNGVRQRALVRSFYVNKYHHFRMGSRLSTGKSFFKLGHKKPYTIRIQLRVNEIIWNNCKEPILIVADSIATGNVVWG